MKRASQALRTVKIIALAGVFAAASFAVVTQASADSAYRSPGSPQGFVSDFAHVIPVEQRTALEDKLSGFEKETGAEIAVATVSSLGGDTIEDFAVNLFAEWQIGKKDADNGVLILVSPNDRVVRIEVGYGLEPTVTDAASSVIIRNVMLPQFKTGAYATGIEQATNVIMGLIQNDPAAAKFVAQNALGSGAQSVPIFVPILVIIIFIILVSTRTGRRVLFYMFISGMFRGDGGGKGGFGGGFGGFGGGRSGGGGASGRW